MAGRARIIIKGVVQGVGFRPYVYTLARNLGLKGFVTNTESGVFIDIEGNHLDEFLRRLSREAPPLSRIADLSIARLPRRGYQTFTIQQSEDRAGDGRFTFLSPDVSICDDCLQELFDPADRRYLYPFINCTHCGPRYSITRSIPYDRPNTTMARFHLCPRCRDEYDDPEDRRFHAQPNACPTCGPHVQFRPRHSEEKQDGREAFYATIRLLQDGGIVAIKGIGGFHIACDAMNDGAVKRLRERKRRSNKPFAVMCPDIPSLERFSIVSHEEKLLLLSRSRPVVLLNKKTGGVDPGISGAVSPNNRSVGCMLPYTPLHYLLFYHPVHERLDPEREQGRAAAPHFSALVMTSGNRSEEPIVRDNEEAIELLSDVVDGFLLHNRDIFMRVDDSVVRILTGRQGDTDTGRSEGVTPRPLIPASPRQVFFIRRSRGYAPEPIALDDDGPEVLACGADLKNTFTITKGNTAIPSQHIGDMENYETVKFFEESLENLTSVYRANPAVIAHDLHPGYLSTKWAQEQSRNAVRGVQSAECGMRKQSPQPPFNKEGRGGISQSEMRNPKSEITLFAIQHHYAHIGSVMAENGLKETVVGVAFDGTGYGIDGHLWGGEFLVADVHGFERVAQFKYIPLPGGESAIQEPWKTAVSYLCDAAGQKAADDLLCGIGFMERYGKETIERIKAVIRVREISPLSSGAGRLFDAMSAMIGLCDRNTYEGEAPMALESIVAEGMQDEYPFECISENGFTIIDFSKTILGAAGDVINRKNKAYIATKFHNTVASAVRDVVVKTADRFSLNAVALSGGTFQNRYLLQRAVELLTGKGYSVYVNQKVPSNDAGISLGQAFIVRERVKRKHGA